MTRRSRTRRRSVRRGIVALGGAVTVMAMSALPVDAASEDVDIVAVDSAAHPIVTLMVEPPDGLASSDLNAENFTLTENGTAIDVTVERATGTGQAAREILEVVLVVDASGSMEGEPLSAAKEAAGSFLAQMPEGTRVGVIVFGDAPALVAPVTDDHGTAINALGPIEATGETALYDAVTMGLAQFSGEEGTRHALIVLTDGGDTASEATLEATTAAVSDAGAEFAAVELVTAEYDGSALRTLAGAAGGAVLSVDDPGQLASLYDDVAADLLNRYAITYTSATGGEASVALTVQANGIQASTSRSIVLPGTSGAGVVAPEPTASAEPGWFGSSTARAVGLGLFFIALAGVLAVAFLSPREARVRMADRFVGKRVKGTPLGSEWAQRFSHAAERQLERKGRDRALYDALERAGIALRPGEFVTLGAGVALVSLVLGSLLGGPVVGILLAAVAAGGLYAYVQHRGTRRKAQFADQLADTLQLLTGSLRVGHSMLQAIDSVATDAPAPTRDEFQRLIVEVRLGRDVREALRAMHTRIGNDDFEWVVQALEIHRDVGGDLAEVLDTVANTVRERAHLRRQVRSLSAEGRLSGLVLLALPVAVALIVSMTNPAHLAPLFDTGLGKVMVALGVVLMGVGTLWIRKLIRVEL